MNIKAYPVTTYDCLHTFIFLLLFLKLLIYLAAPGLSCTIWTLNCSMWDLVPWAGIEPEPHALGVWSLNHWTPGKVSAYTLLQSLQCVVLLFLTGRRFGLVIGNHDVLLGRSHPAVPLSGDNEKPRLRRGCVPEAWGFSVAPTAAMKNCNQPTSSKHKGALNWGMKCEEKFSKYNRILFSFFDEKNCKLLDLTLRYHELLWHDAPLLPPSQSQKPNAHWELTGTVDGSRARHDREWWGLGQTGWYSPVQTAGAPHIWIDCCLRGEFRYSVVRSSDFSREDKIPLCKASQILKSATTIHCVDNQNTAACRKRPVGYQC